MKVEKKKVKVYFVWLVIISLIVYFAPMVITVFKCRSAAEYAKANDLLEFDTDRKDAWGNPLILERVAEKMYVVYSVRSMGRDGIDNTGDDIIRGRVDINKSRIAGEWVGEKSTEAFKGLMDGIKKESKFKKD